MARCWETRGCDEEMQGDCLHHTHFKDKCPSKCAFAQCDRPTHELTTDPALVFSTTAERAAAIKEECIYCGFFLRHGPRLDGSDPVEGDAADDGSSEGEDG